MRASRLLRRLLRDNILARQKAKRHLAELEKCARHYERQAAAFKAQIDRLRLRTSFKR
jgi:hypothetical protein